jgi:Mg-chelatase subunit ChlD
MKYLINLSQNIIRTLHLSYFLTFVFRLSPFTLLIAWLLFQNSIPVYAAESSGANILFILDASGSMWAKVEKKDKIAIAKEVMTNLIKELPEGVNVGLEVYGHRKKGDCDDIEVLIPVGKGNKDALIKQIQAIQPKGETPITKSLELAGEKLKEMEGETTVVLVSDGKESCKGDPCALVKSLKEKGIKAQIHVVGFGVTDEEKQQLTCIAEAGGGKYFTAQNASQLKGALTEVKKQVIEKVEVKEEPKPQPKEKKVIKLSVSAIKIPNLQGRTVEVYTQEDEKWVGNISVKEKMLEVTPGTYKLKFTGYFLEGIEVKAGDPVEIILGSIHISNLTKRTVEVFGQQSDEWAGNLSSSVKNLEIPAGTYKLKFTGHYMEGVKVEAGKSTEISLGSISIPNLSGRTIEVFAQQPEAWAGNISPTEKTLEVPAGSYKLKFTGYYLENINVEADKSTEVSIGSISIPNLSARTIEVYEQKSEQWVGNISPKEKTLDLPAGTYKLKFGSQFVTDIMVEAGQDVTIEQ